MKRSYIVVLAFVFALALAACGGNASSGTSQPESTAVPAPATPAPTEQPASDGSPTAQQKAEGWVIAPRTDLEITGSLADYTAPANGALDNQAGLSFFEQDGKTGVIDQKGKIVIPASEDVHWCAECGITNADESKIFNAFGEVVGQGGHGVTDAQILFDTVSGQLYLQSADTLYPFAEYMASVQPYVARRAAVALLEDGTDAEYYVEDGQTGEVQPASCQLQEGYVLIASDTGRQLNGQVYEDIQAYAGGLFAVCQNGLWGYVDMEGTAAIPCQYQAALPFYNSLAAVQDQSGLWGYINLAGTPKTEFAYLAASTAVDGKAWVKTSEGWGVMTIS